MKIITNNSDLSLLQDRNYRSGPGIASASDLYFLKDEDYIEYSNLNDFNYIKNNNLLVWSRGGHTDLNKIKENGIKIILGPDYLFFDSFNREKQHFIFDYDNIVSVFILNHSDYIGCQYLKGGSKFKGSIKRVRHFLRPEMYSLPFKEDYEWDILLYKKGIQKDSYIKNIVKNKNIKITTLVNGQYTFEELIYKAERSKLCIYDSQWESYGLAAQEIMARGCPVICNRTGIQEGNFIEGRMGLYASNNLPYFDGTFASMIYHKNVMMCSNSDEMDRLIGIISQWKKKDVYEAAMEFNDVNIVKKMYRNAFQESINSYRF